jgi:hypothetical protein
MSSDPIRAIADAVLYEGYILWPYRRSALKNQRRFTFGGVYPLSHEKRHPDDPATMRTEVLAQANGQTQVSITGRFLQIAQRTVSDANGARHDDLVVGGERYVSWEEAVEREIRTPPLNLDGLHQAARFPIEIAAGSEREPLPGGAALIRSWKDLAGELVVQAVALSDGLWRLSVTISNNTRFDYSDRQRALTHTFCSTHALLALEGGEFVSLTDPPAELKAAAEACRNAGTWPVLVGEPGERRTMLSSPIILEDYPRVAPESPGDLFDGGEIDQLLILNILALSDSEQEEMAASDPRAKEILERTRSLTPEQLMALHGTVREFGMVR